VTNKKVFDWEAIEGFFVGGVVRIMLEYG